MTPAQSPSTTPTRSEAALRGVQELLPLSPGVFAGGLVTGVALVKSGLSVSEALGLSLLAYAGSAQLAALPLIATAAPLWLVTLTALIVNLRFVVYSAVTRVHFLHLSASRRLWLGYIVGDVMFVRFTSLLEKEPDYPQRIAYYTGGALCNWVVWQVSSILGIFAAERIPAEWGLELAGTLALISLLVPLCRQRATLCGVIVAGVVAVLAHDWPLRLGMLLGIGLGMAAAMTIERVAPTAVSS
jgi:predicted branched-subunit amino acid permease